ncbi:prepilin-type N-terminal cleavage/methylation domain-containing protein [Candidatus Curtissbacteria bacterium]|nr:prepilin-type N-terminal cleavage/methylation domain-containing protein [Candidatus Curtissbacteria bacterium]
MASNKKVTGKWKIVNRFFISIHLDPQSEGRGSHGSVYSPFTIHKKQGFTLIELLAGLAVGGFVIVIIASIYMAHFRLFSDQNTAIDTATQNKLALDEITNQIRQAQAVVSTCASCNPDTTGVNILILQIWPLDESGDPKDPGASNYDYIEYRKDPADPAKLIRKTFPHPSSSRQSGTRVVATAIESLSFTYDNADPAQALEVTTAVTTTGTAGGKTQITSQSAKAILRNK